jgi:hypothetical protein
LEITLRDAVTVIHGMGFGALLLLAFSGAVVGFYATSVSRGRWILADSEHNFFCWYYGIMAALAWGAVFAGAYLVYPWYRARPPAGTTDLAAFPQRLLMTNPSTIEWHNIGMEWKEHIAWFAPISLTAVTYIFARYGKQLPIFKGLRNAAIGLTALAFVATCIAGLFGAMLNKYAPVRGGPTIALMKAAGDE